MTGIDLKFKAAIRVGAACVLAVFLLCAPHAARADLAKDSDLPVRFESETLTHDDQAQTVTATGDVEIEQGGKILHADKVIYDLNTDTVTATGNVSVMDENGDVHFAEYAQLSQNMKNGFIKGLLSLLTDGSRFTAAEGKRENGIKTTMTDATYTPCKVCETDPHPLWQIKASKVVHDEVKKTIEYKNARMEFAGVPFFYTPILSHPDPSVTRKSGVLRPRYGWSSDTGGYIEGGYYFGDIAPDKDLSLWVRPTTLEGTLVSGEWRQRFENGQIKINASGVQSDRTEEDGRVEDNRNRGHIFANGLFDLDDKWRAGFGLQEASDKNYLRLYDISNQNVLDSEAYAERFSGRDYTRISALSFRDIRLGIQPEQPQVFPMFKHNMTGAPQSLLGGRWDAGISSVALFRSAQSGQDMQRFSGNLGWERRFVADSGLTTRTRLEGRSDFYNVNDNTAALAAGEDGHTQEVRSNAVASVLTSYPLSKRIAHGNIIVEPLAGVYLSPKLNEDDIDVPNEDSIDLQLDSTNLFDENRFPGVDEQEDGLRVSYGVRSGLYGDDGKFGKFFIGQSRRFEDSSIYPEGSGLDEKDSDIVGQVNFGLSQALQADYVFQLDNENLSAQRHELGAQASTGGLSTSMRYFYVAGIQGTGFEDAREQMQLAANYHWNNEWSSYASTLSDLGEEPGLRRAVIGLSYANDCFSFSTEGQRNLTSDAAGESETSVMMRIGFKNLGEFSAPDIKLTNGAAE